LFRVRKNVEAIACAVACGDTLFGIKKAPASRNALQTLREKVCQHAQKTISHGLIIAQKFLKKIMFGRDLY